MSEAVIVAIIVSLAPTVLAGISLYKLIQTKELVNGHMTKLLFLTERQARANGIIEANEEKK